MKAVFEATLNLVLFWCTLARGACPAAYKILPCKYEVKNNKLNPIITCDKVENSEDLLKAMLQVKREKIFMLNIVSASFMFFPGGLFNESQVEVLKIQDSSIFSLGERNPAFSGLEDTLKSLEISGCTFVNNWKWSELNKMKVLHRLEISGSELFELPYRDISHISIEYLSFKNNFIDELPYQVFRNFTSLKRLALDNNDIKDIMRSSLPIPATNLEAIGLSYNKIQRLHINTFDQMPALRYLYLGGNPLHTLNEDVFKPVWNQLQMALFQDCPLVCDCHIMWIPKSKQARKSLIGGTCDSPMQLKDKKLTQLLPKHFPSCR